MLADVTINGPRAGQSDRSIADGRRRRVADELAGIFAVRPLQTMAGDADAAIRKVRLASGGRHRLFSLIWLGLLAMLAGMMVLFAIWSKPQARLAPPVATPRGAELTVAGAAAEPVAVPRVEIRRPSPAPSPEIERRVPAVEVARPAARKEPADPMASPAACADLDRSSHAWCMRPALLRADEQLRTAYDRAVEAGVDRQLLLFYRSRWTRMRREATDDPQSVINHYEQIARELRVETGRRR